MRVREGEREGGREGGREVYRYRIALEFPYNFL